MPTDVPTPGTDEMPIDVLLSAEAIQTRIAALAAALDRDYAGRTPVLCGVLTGAAIFLADLVRQMHGPVEVDFIAVSS